MYAMFAELRTAFFPVPPGNEILVRLRTDQGLEGFGLCSSYSSIEPLVAWNTQLLQTTGH